MVAAAKLAAELDVDGREGSPDNDADNDADDDADKPAVNCANDSEDDVVRLCCITGGASRPTFSGSRLDIGDMDVDPRAK
jgi:hypothetical protein